MRVSAAWERNSMQYPAVIVYAGETEPIVESATWHDARNLAVDVAVITEAAPELDANNAVVRTPRERNAAARSMVMDALFTTTLLTDLIAQGVANVAFSMAQFVKSQRSNEGTHLVTTISGLVIAEPITGS
jgi:hypothetical protein